MTLEESRSLLKGLLEKDPAKRMTVPEILKHPWFKNLEKSMQIFNEQEKEKILNEFTYNDARRVGRNDTNAAADCFTTLPLDSTDNPLIKNVSSKSIILAPFNSTKSHNSLMHDSIREIMFDKNLVIKFAARVRDIDRQYELNNNCELDNGVYNKFVYNSPNEEKKKYGDSEDEESGGGSEDSLRKTEDAKQDVDMMDFNLLIKEGSKRNLEEAVETCASITSNYNFVIGTRGPLPQKDIFFCFCAQMTRSRRRWSASVTRTTTSSAA